MLQTMGPSTKKLLQNVLLLFVVLAVIVSIYLAVTGTEGFEDSDLSEFSSEGDTDVDLDGDMDVDEEPMV